MNHIYKVIWNTITQTWVAVSELSRAKGKTKSSKTLSAVVLAAVSAGAIVGDAEAATNFVQNQTGIAITRSGGDAPATASDRWAIAVGDSAKANSEYSIAVGGHTNATGESAIAIGKQTKVEGQGATAVGRVTLASAQYSSAYGAQAKATGNQSTALGYVANAAASNSLAAGALAQAQGESSVALGRDAQAWGSGASAVGEGSRANNSNAFAGGNGAQATGSWATAVGPSTLASGEASAAYGDGSEATGKKSIATGSHASASAENAIAIGNSTKAQANNTIAIGNDTKATDKSENSLVIGQGAVVTAKDATVVGPVAQANGENATAVGRGAAANGTESTALGRGSVATGNQSIALGKGANAKVDSGVALGDDSVADRTARSQNGIVINTSDPSKSTGFNTENSVYAPVRLVDTPEALNLIKNTIKGNKGAVSVGDSGNTRQIINVAAGSADSDAVNVAQLKAVAGAIKHYDVVSPNGDITVTHPDPHDPNKTVWNLNLNPDRVKEITKWKLRDVEENGNPEAGKTDALVKGDETVTFQDTDTIEVERVGTDGKTLKFHTKKNIKYFSVNSSKGGNENNDGATVIDAIAIGKDASSTGSSAVSLGLGAKALGANNTAIGPGAQAKDVRTTAIGYNANASEASAVSIGYAANAAKSRSLAIGQDATASANNAIALGSSRQHGENKTTASAEHAVAIGSGAEANIANGIALGSESKTTATSASGQSGFDASQDVEGARTNKYNNLKNNVQNVRTSTLAGLSIGDTDKTRQINHLAAGTADDDAVNVAQLKSVNLAFKGDNNTKGDVRLHDQRLSVVGATGSFITTKANDNKLEISTTQGTFSTTADGKSSSTTAGLATTTAVASAINESGWEVQAKGTKVGLVNPGDKVDFTNADNSIEIESSAEANGLSTIKFKAVTAKINTEKKHPVEITINNGITTKKIDKTKQATPTGKFVVPTGDDTNKYALATAYDVADKVNQTGWNLYTNGGEPALINPGDYVNFKSGNATNANVVTEASEGATISYDVNVDNTTIKIDPNGNKLTANTGDVDSVTNTEGNNKKGQVTIHKDSLEPSKTDSGKLATVDTVVKAVNNAKWFAKADNNGGEIADNAKTNDVDDADGQAMGAGDKLTLKAGKNLRVKRDGANFTFATDNDVTFNKVTSNEFVVNPNGKFTVGTGSTINMGDNIVGGVKTGVADTDAVNVAQLKANATTVVAGKNVSVDVAKNASTGKTFTVHSEKTTVSKENNSPIKLTSTENASEHTTDYKVGLDIDEGTLEVKNGKLAAKAQVKAIEVVESKEGDDNIAKVNVKSGQNKGDAGATYQVSVTKNDVKDTAKEAVDVRGSDFITVTPTDGEHLKTHTVAAKTGEITVAEATGSVTSIATATGLTTNKAVADAIAKSGFQLKQGEEATAKTVINPGDSLTFKDGQGTKAVVNANGDVTINANVASLTGGDNVTVKDNGNGSFTISATDTNTQASVSKAANSPITINATGADNAKNYELDVAVDGTTISKAGGTLHAETGAIEEVTTTTGDNAKKKGQVQAKPNDENKVATVSNVANAINKAKWFAKADNNGGEIADNAKTNDADDADGQAMGAGDKLTLKAGKNLRVKRDGANFTFATDNDVTFNKVTSNEFVVNPNGKFTVGSGATINMGDNIIHGVATGVADTDAVNVAQLKSTEHHITPATYVYNDADKSVTLTYTDGNGNLVKNTNAKIDLSGLASKIKDYSFKTNATGSNLVETGTETTVASGKSVNFAASDNLTLKQDVNNGNVTYTYGLKNQVAVGEKGTPGADGKPGKDGVDGSIGVNGKDGSAVAINGKDGSIGLNGKNGENGLTIKGDKGAVGVDGTNGKDGKDGMTRIVYTDNNQVKHEVATLDDGQKYAGDNYVAAKDNQAESNVIAKKANERLDIVGGAKGNLTEGNIGVNAKDGKLHVQLAEKVNLGDKGSVTIGDTVVNNNGITINSPADLNNVTNKTVSLTNQGLNNGGNKITNVAEGKDDTDAVNVKQLKDFKAEVADGGLTFAGNSGTAHKAKLNTTVNIKGGKDNTDATQFDDGKNVMTTVNNNTVTVAIKKTPEVEGINIIDKDGKVKVKLTQTNEGLKVSDGNDKETRITNVAEGKNGTDAVNVKQLNAAKTELTAGDNIDVRSSTGANGQTIYKVSANDTSAAVEAGSDHVKVTKAANTHKDGSTTVTDYTVDLSKETKEDIKKGVDAHTEVTTKGLTFNADHGTTGVKKLGSKVAVKGDGKNITTTANENGVTVSMEDNIKVNSVTAKEVKVGDVNINENGINAGGKRITNVAPGKDGTDAVNVNQLKYVAGNISNQINNVDKGLRAGIAGALASGGLYHVTTAGKSMVSVGAGTYRGQNALAVGYSRLSDNGKVGVKFTVNSNSQGHSGASASVGYQW